MKISLTKIKNWTSKTRLKEIEKRLEQIEEDVGLSKESEDLLKQIFLILKVERRNNVNENIKPVKIDPKKTNIFE